MGLSRRVFLRGLGGAVVAAPFLSSIAERTARSRGIPPSGDPRRWIAMFTHYGCLTNRWFPRKSHGPLTADDLMGTTLSVLAPQVNKLLLPRGIRAMNEWNAQLTHGQGNDPHTQVVGSYFTCVPVTPHGTDPFSFEAATKFEAMPTAASLDHVCAKQLNADGMPLLMHVGGMNDTPTSGISYSAGETPFDGYTDPTDVFSKLTGLFASGAPASPDSYLVARGKSVIDVVRTDLETLERVDMSKADRDKLQAWKDLLNQTTSVFRSAQCNADTAEMLGLTSANLQAVVTHETDRVAGKITDDLDGADLHSDLAVLAALCDQSRVIVLKYPANYIFRGLGLTHDSHTLSHRIGSANMAGSGCLSNVNEMIYAIDSFYAAKFAHLVQTLDSFDEGSGTLLDNSAAVWFQEMSDGNAHNLNNMPLLQAGSCGGFFKTGVAVNVDDGSDDMHAGNSEFVCSNSPTISAVTDSGTPADIANAPINKFYCSLMNALGVKAGPDGFPMPGGSDPVTHYGMYDNTRDFASGGENPPRINDPGGFADLEAS